VNFCFFENLTTGSIATVMGKTEPDTKGQFYAHSLVLSQSSYMDTDVQIKCMTGPLLVTLVCSKKRK